MANLFKLIRPKSLTNPAYEAFEYLLKWQGRDSSEYIYMFYDAELQTKVANEVINEQDSARLSALVSKVSQDITLNADDVSRNDVVIIGQIFEQRFVLRVLKDGTTERYAPDAGSFKYRLSDGRYELQFKLVKPDIKAWR
jgi:hypothetical protein